MQSMQKKFFEYAKIGDHYPTINEVTYPHCPTYGEDPDVFLVYAEDRETAFRLALAHRYEGKPLERFYGTYNEERYFGEIMCVIE